MPLGRYFGVKILLTWPLLAILTAAATTGLWVHAAILLGVLLTHELAHLMAAKGFDLPVARVELHPFGGVARLEGSSELDPHLETTVAVAGPINNFLLAGLGYWVQRFGAFQPELVDFFLEANLLMGLFNLLPALPLDGGRIYRAFLGRKLGYGETTRRLAVLGRTVGLLLVAAGAAALMTGRIYPTLPVLGVCLFLAARNEEAQAGIRFWLNLLGKKDALSRQGVLPLQTLVVSAGARLGDLPRQFVSGRYHIFTVLDSSMSVIGQVTETHLAEAMMEFGPDYTVGEVVAAIEAEPPG